LVKATLHGQSINERRSLALWLAKLIEGGDPELTTPLANYLTDLRAVR